MINIIADPNKYDGKKILVVGYLHLEFEGNILYIHKDDYDYGISKNGVWIDTKIKHPEVGDLKRYSDHYVIIEGIFNSKMNGHMGMNSGSLEKISRLEIIEFENSKLKN